jgi:hypothetical protein
MAIPLTVAKEHSNDHGDIGGPTEELGWSGLSQSRGTVTEEWSRALQGKNGMRIYREMVDDDPVIGAYLTGVKQQLIAAEWTIEPGVDDAKGAERAEFLNECVDGLSHTWESFIGEALTKLEFGWSFAETVYEQRDDGKLGWRKFAFRSQETLDRWLFDENGDITGLVQTGPDHKPLVIPMAKSMLFRTTTAKGNPEGRSVLRNSYVSWHYKKRLQEFQAIGAERDLAGIPIIGLPPEYFAASATPTERAAKAMWEKIATELRHDERASIVHPIIYDEDGRELVRISLLSASGARQQDIGGMLSYYDHAMATSLAADVILLGQDGVGSLALGSVKRDMWIASMEAYLSEIEEVINRVEVPRLFELNGDTVPREELPFLRAGTIDAPDPAGIAEFLGKVAPTGWINPTEEDEAYLRTVVGLPQTEEGTAEDVE